MEAEGAVADAAAGAGLAEAAVLPGPAAILKRLARLSRLNGMAWNIGRNC